jgi:release factor glutamine methyltransferase
MIYSPAEDSFLLAKEVEKYAFGRVLDMATGSGIQAEKASNSVAVKSVLAADIAEDSVEYVNSLGLNNTKAIKSDLFSDVFGKYDTIIFNPPYLPQDEREDAESALITTGGLHGHELVERFLDSASLYLSNKGIILMVFSSLTGKEKVEEIIQQKGFIGIPLSSQKISFEELYVYMVKRNS